MSRGALVSVKGSVFAGERSVCLTLQTTLFFFIYFYVDPRRRSAVAGAPAAAAAAPRAAGVSVEGVRYVWLLFSKF